MFFIIILFYTVFVTGLLLLASAVFIRASPKASAVVSKSKSFDLKSKKKNIEAKISKRIQIYVKLSDEKKKDLEKMLGVVRDKRSAEEFISDALTTSFLVGFLGVFLVFINPIYTLISLLIGFYIFYIENKALKTDYKKIRVAIEDDLPMFCSVISAKLSSTSVVQEILKSFIPIANPQMKSELEYTINDMQLSSVEASLLRLEQRITSPKLSDVVRGLISVAKGDEQTIFFQTKQFEFTQDRKTIKKRDISMRSEKLTPTMMALFLIFILLISHPMVSFFQTYMSKL